MEKTIWKFELPIRDEVLLRIPCGGSVLSLQMQGGVPCIWVMVDPEKVLEDRTFEVYGTGHPIKCGVERRFIGTFQMHGGLVFHVFERATDGRGVKPIVYSPCGGREASI